MNRPNYKTLAKVPKVAHELKKIHLKKKHLSQFGSAVSKIQKIFPFVNCDLLTRSRSCDLVMKVNLGWILTAKKLKINKALSFCNTKKCR